MSLLRQSALAIL